MFVSLHGAGNLTAVAFEFSPYVEQTAADTVVLDASGLDRLIGPPHEVTGAIARRARRAGAQADVALASNPDAAICAARGFRGINIIPDRDEAKFLGELPIALLNPSDELRQTLDRWGIRLFRELAALPPLGIAERLGPEGLRLRELARGEATRKLRLIEDPLHFEDEMELEYPLDLIESLLFPISSLLHNIALRLATRALATDELRLRLKLEDRTTHECTLQFPVPALDVKAFLKLFQLHLERHSPQAPVVHVRLEANHVKPRVLQNGLFIPASPEPLALQLTVSRLQAIVGEGRVGSPDLLDTHRPDAFRMTGFGQTKPHSAPGLGVRLAFCAFRPAKPATVLLHREEPAHVAAPGVRGKVIEKAGPWTGSGDWWTADPWSFREWDIALSDGGIYRLYAASRSWYVRGRYD
jgi:protein ImuB